MKIPPKRVPSDDCLVYVGRVIEGDKITNQGKGYAVHEGEWVETLPVATVAEAIAISRMLNVTIKQVNKIAEGLDQICEGLAKRIIGWNWTDNDGKNRSRLCVIANTVQFLTPKSNGDGQSVSEGHSNYSPDNNDDDVPF